MTDQEMADCRAAHIIDVPNDMREKAHKEFLKMYPPIKLSSCFTQRDLLPDRTAFAAAFAEPTEEEVNTGTEKDGRYLFGPSGTAKTRCAIQLAERQILLGDNVSWWTAYDLKQSLFAMRNDAYKKQTLINWLSSIDWCMLFFLDDLGHHVSEPFLEVVRVLLENRASYGFVVTSQYSLEEFVERCHEKGMGRLGEAIARRLYEGCKRIQFVRGRKAAGAEQDKPVTQPVEGTKAFDDTDSADIERDHG